MRLLDRLHNPESKYSVRQLLRWLWRNLRGNRVQVVFNSAIGMLGVGCSLMMVWAMQRTIDMASGAREGSLYWGVALMGAVIVAEFALNISRIWIKNILGIRAQNRMQQQMLDRLLRAEWQSKDHYHSGDIINRLEQDVQTVVTFITETLPNTLSVLILFFGAFFYLLSMDAWLACITVGVLPLFHLVSDPQDQFLTAVGAVFDPLILHFLPEIIQQFFRRLNTDISHDHGLFEFLKEFLADFFIPVSIENDIHVVGDVRFCFAKALFEPFKKTHSHLFLCGHPSQSPCAGRRNARGPRLTAAAPAPDLRRQAPPHRSDPRSPSRRRPSPAS